VIPHAVVPVVCLVVWCLTLSFAEAAPPAQPSYKVEEVSICRNVENLTCVGAGEIFPAGISKLYCFTKIVDAKVPTSVTHIWYYGNREMARVVLPIRYESWRTYSYLSFHQDWPGKWSVAIVSPNNEILKVATFIIETR
jgi:hypothetical protein